METPTSLKSRMGSDGRLPLPDEVRRQLCLQPEDEVIFIQTPTGYAIHRLADLIEMYDQGRIEEFAADDAAINAILDAKP